VRHDLARPRVTQKNAAGLNENRGYEVDSYPKPPACRQERAAALGYSGGRKHALMVCPPFPSAR
jgi:hypothetical protein